MTIAQDLTAFIARNGTELVTDSRAVALAFKKQHRHVLRAIRSMLESDHAEIRDHAESNFGLSEYTDASGRALPMYRMTAKGLSELAMSFSGNQARVIRIRFLNAFEEVANRLARTEQTLTQMLHDLELRELPSIVKGQIGSQLMHQRRKEKPAFAETRATLMTLAQPDLLAGPATTETLQ